MTLTYDGKSIVTVEEQNVPDESFSDRLAVANEIMLYFRQTRPGSTWGCDGVGYEIQKKLHHIVVHKSGVGSRIFKSALPTVLSHFPQLNHK
jgi:hypothetical protein